MPTDTACLQKGENILVTDGTSQAQRYLPALKPSYAPVDEHGVSDYIVFARAYSAFLRYYDSNNAVADDWENFFGSDVSVLLAETTIQNIDYYRLKITSYFDVLKDNASSDEDLKDNLGYLFSAAGTFFKQIDLLKERLPASQALKATLQNLIQRQLASVFRRLIAYYKAGKNNDLIPDNVAPELKILESVCKPFEESYQHNFSGEWFTEDAANWDTYTSNIPEDATVYGNDNGAFERINHIATHNLFTTAFDLVLKAYSRIVSDAATALKDSLSSNNAHQPHYTLFLSFLQLMEYVRQHMNTLTGKHLDFYYREVLRMKKKRAEPNHAHLLIQLAKKMKSHELKSGTAFSGGKDSLGKEVTYTLDKDFVPNIATVSAIKSVCRTKSLIYAFPVANSDNGRGAELTSTDQQWPLFTGKNEKANLAIMGFAISSHYLFLGEGQRRITLRLAFTEQKVSQDEICKAFDFLLTGKEKWIAASVQIATPSTDKETVLEIPLLLDGSQPPIVALDRKVHGETLPKGLPALKAVLKQHDTAPETLEALRSLKLVPSQSSLAVAVGYDGLTPDSPNEMGLNEMGLKNLSLFSKLGQVKPDKPFQPFGPLPEKNDYLIIGCDELFQKQGAKFQCRVVWKGLPDSGEDIDFDSSNDSAPDFSLTFLKNGTWSSKPDIKNVQLFSGTHSDIYFPKSTAPLPEDAISEIHFDPLPYTIESRNGFMKLTLLGDFGHTLYRLTLSRYMIKEAKGDIDPQQDRATVVSKAREKVFTPGPSGKLEVNNPYTFIPDYVEAFSDTMPVEPYTPQIESLSLSYWASVNLNDTSFSWLTPFGYKSLDTDNQVRLLPEFDYKGEVYIGIEKLEPGQNLSLLFQLAEGSADPTVKKPEKHVQWSYLSSKTGQPWVNFNDTGLSDQTGQLTRSGIIRYTIPKDATKTDTQFLPAGYYWVRAVVEEYPLAVCNAIAVVAQAEKVTFKDQNNADDFLASQLPKKTIKKLVVPNAAVKNVSQPYPTFGGRPTESAETFSMRVSERLRHKNRAVTLWDYERLVLEAFPQIYKVKCLNHTCYKPGNRKASVYRESAPGHVTIITIPKLHNHNAIDPLRPYTNLGDLELICNYLEQQVSGFVRLHVANPVFESIRVSFKVKFYPDTDSSNAMLTLQNSLVNFLSPWAFNEGKDISFGGKIYKSSLIDFVEEQPGVDYVIDFKLYHQLSDGTESNDTDVVSASKAISILVSAKASDHTIELVDDEVDE